MTSRFKPNHLLPLVLAAALAGCATPAPLATAPVPSDSPSTAPQAAAPSAAPIVVPEQASLQGLVEVNGRGLAQATVTAYAPGSNTAIATTTTDEAGRFQMSATHAGGGAYRLQQQTGGASRALIRLVAVKSQMTLATFVAPSSLPNPSNGVNVRLDAATTTAVSGLAPLLNLSANGTVGTAQAHSLMQSFTTFADEARAGLQGTGTAPLQTAIAGVLDSHGNGRLNDTLKLQLAAQVPTFPSLYHRAIDTTVATLQKVVPTGNSAQQELASLSSSIGVFPSRSGGSAGPNGPVGPAIASMSAAAGPAGGGNTITLTGQRFTGTQSVTFGTTPAAFTVDSDTQLTLTAPAHAAGTVPISVTTANGTIQSAQTYAYHAAPTVAGVSPSVGPLAGGGTVTVTGAHFTSGATVSIGGHEATAVDVASDTQLTATVPAGATGAADVVVTTPGGSATVVGAYTYAPAPTITSLSPASGALAGGGSVTITGTGFSHASAVTFGNTAATSFQVTDAQHITATVPAGAAGAVNVAVTTPGGGATAAGAYTYAVIPAPMLTSVSPNSGPIAGGTSVTLYGTNLAGTTAVSFGGVAATNLTVVNNSTVTATAPAHAAGAVDVQITTSGGTATRAGGYTYVASSVYIIAGISARRDASVFNVVGTSLDMAQVTAVNYIDGATGQAYPCTIAALMPQMTAIKIGPTAPLGTGTISVVHPSGTFTTPQTVTVVP